MHRLSFSRYDGSMETGEILEQIKKTSSPLKRQLLLTALVTRLLEEKGKPAPVLIGGCALSYYSREVYFTADIDIAYADTQALDDVLRELNFIRQGRYWTNEALNVALEAPAGVLSGEEAPLEVVEFEGGLRCQIIGVEDLIIDRLNACKHWKSESDGEMAELLLKKYFNELNWEYLEKKALLPENNTKNELSELKKKTQP